MKFLMGAMICAMELVAQGGGRSPLEQVPSGLASRSNPFTGSSDARRAGAKLYRRECAACHGANREGVGKKPPLNGTGVHSAPPAALFYILRNGSIHSGMPSFAHLPEAQRWQIITFLLETKP